MFPGSYGAVTCLLELRLVHHTWWGWGGGVLYLPNILELSTLFIKTI